MDCYAIRFEGDGFLTVKIHQNSHCLKFKANVGSLEQFQKRKEYFA